MGCCYSYTKRSKRLQHRSGATVTSSIEKHGQETPIIDAHVLDAAFSEFSFSVLKMATDNFSSKRFLSENGAINFVYKGKLMDTNNRTLWIAVKKFTKAAWPDPKQFAVTKIILLFRNKKNKNKNLPLTFQVLIRRSLEE